MGRAVFGVSVPDDVEDDSDEARVGVVAVGVPISGEGINLDVAGKWKIIAGLDDGLAEIGAGLVVTEAGVKDA